MKVILMTALTVDGIIARSSDHFPDWTGREDKRMFKEMTLKAGVLIMGSKTYDTIGRPLPGRKNVVMSRDKRRVSDREDLVFTDKPPRELLADLRQEGFEAAILAGGSQINSIFAREDLIDEIHLTYVPQIFGTGLSLFRDSISMQLELIDFKQLGTGQIFARYRVIREALA
ncbi:MAG: dihydrofolate reductase family protein [Deltaproteobacteria bacterium]|nr:dihydrofolate reductase family protein [Deltaproteobacteria bacterium]